jgi:hypothetical protein
VFDADSTFSLMYHCDIDAFSAVKFMNERQDREKINCGSWCLLCCGSEKEREFGIILGESG